MEKSNKFHRSDLTAEAFDLFPIWTWDDAEEGYNPLVGTGSLPAEFPTIFIRAIFITASGKKLKGCLTGLESFYAFGLFTNGKEYIINLNLPDLASQAVHSIATDLGECNIFPLRYISDVEIDGRPLISGVFDNIQS